MKFYHGGLVLDVPETVYYPMEDSLLLAKVLEKENLEGKTVLEMGCGSGFLSIVMAKSKAKVTATDISKDAIQTTKNNAEKSAVALTCIQSDLFSAVNGKFDLIVFNPPYLPEGHERIQGKEQLVGGLTGREVIERFLKGAKAHLEKDGKILLLISSLTGEKETIELCKKYGFSASAIATEKIEWEKLIAIKIY